MHNEHDNVWHPFTRFSALEAAALPVIRSAEGIYLTDDQGNRYIDAISSWWCMTLGHGHPRLIEAIRRQSAVLQHSILGNLSNAPADALARRLVQTMPSPDRHVMFASDGSCAVDAAMKIATQYHYNLGNPHHGRFLSLESGYHGDTIGAVSVGYVPGYHEPFDPLLKRSLTVPLPDYTHGEGIEPARRLINQYGDEIAAAIVEPLCQGAAGMRMYDARFLSDLAELCRTHDILLIVDEIAMGFGRTGSYWAFEQAGIDPDMVCVGKGITGGYLPLSAVVCKDYIYRTFSDLDGIDRTFYHGHTFSGNPIAAACALEAMDIYDEMDIAARARILGNQLRRRLGELSSVSGIADVRCLGFIGAVQLQPVEDMHTRAARIRQQLRSAGVLLRPLGDVFYLMPPLVITETQLDDLCDLFIKAIRENI